MTAVAFPLFISVVLSLRKASRFIRHDVTLVKLWWLSQITSSSCMCLNISSILKCGNYDHTSNKMDKRVAVKWLCVVTIISTCPWIWVVSFCHCSSGICLLTRLLNWLAHLPAKQCSLMGLEATGTTWSPCRTTKTTLSKASTQLPCLLVPTQTMIVPATKCSKVLSITAQDLCWFTAMAT